MGENILGGVRRRVERCYLIESPVHPPFCTHAVVAGNVNDQGIVMDAQFFETVDQAAYFWSAYSPNPA